MQYDPARKLYFHPVYETGELTVRALTCLILAATLAGCFPATPDLIRQQPSNRTEFTIAENYQALYRRIVPIMRHCGGEQAWIGDQATVRSEIYSDIRKAEISKEGTNMLLGRRIEWLVELDAIGDKQTKVTVFEGIGKGWSRIIREWAEGKTDC